MKYEIILAPRASSRIEQLPWLLQAAVFEHLDILAESPTAVSRPAVFPRPPEYQEYTFRAVAEGVLHEFTVLFKYGADEQTLHVYALGRIDRGPV